MSAAPAAPPAGPDARLARKILGQMGENGKPPERGISHVNVGNDSYLQILDRVYVNEVIRDADGSSFKLVQGTYGAGKTHFLYCVRDLAWHRNLLAAYVTVSPRECPLNKPLSVYRAVAQRLELPAPDAGGEAIRGIDDVLRRAAADQVAASGKDAARAWVAATVERAAFTRHSFRDAAAAYLRAVIDDAEPTARRLGAWLRGEDVPAAEAKADGVYEAPSNENGFALLRSLLQCVHRLGHEGTVLLFDEAERRLSVETRPTKATTETIDHLRELVDLCGRAELPRTLILYAVTPAFTQNVLPLYPALQQRLGSPVQYLSAHNPKAPLIDLEALDMDPLRLLVEVGGRLLGVARAAYAWAPDEAVVHENLERLARTVTEEQLEVSHRRLFVKLWIRLLDELRLGGERRLGDDEIRALVSDEQVDLLGEPEPSGPVLTFFGAPVGQTAVDPARGPAAGKGTKGSKNASGKPRSKPRK
jgi:bacteriophage exclusion system BrxC/D-like protein